MSLKKIVSNVRPSGLPDSPAVFSLFHGFQKILKRRAEIYLNVCQVFNLFIFFEEKKILLHTLKISDINIKIQI